MSVTGDQIINEALLLLGVSYPGQTPSAEIKATCLLGINFIIGEWNATGQAVYAVERHTFTLSAGTADYTIGPTGTWAMTRPERIEAWSVTTAGGTSDDGVPLDAATFEKVTDDRALTGSRVKALNYEAGFPNGTIHIYPIPNGGQAIALWCWSQIAEVTDTTLALTMPPGYLKALVYCLAVDAANKLGREVPQTTKLIADQCRAALGATNAAQHQQSPATPQAQ
jgi:hypothetical protein